MVWYGMVVTCEYFCQRPFEVVSQHEIAVLHVYVGVSHVVPVQKWNGGGDGMKRLLCV